MAKLKKKFLMLDPFSFKFAQAYTNKKYPKLQRREGSKKVQSVF